VFAVWDGGLGVWGGIALATVVGLWRLRRLGVNQARFMDAVAPALLVAQGIGRIGNYFNKELFGRPTSLPWGLEIPFQYRASGGIPARYLNAATFQPTFLYELIFDVVWAAVLVWLGHHRKIKAPGLFALYVFGYSAYRIFEESLRIDSSAYFLGLRLNTYIASVLALIGLIWFWRSQRRPAPVESADPDPAAAAASLDAEASVDAEASLDASSGLDAPAGLDAPSGQDGAADRPETVNSSSGLSGSELSEPGLSEPGLSGSGKSESAESEAELSGAEQPASSSQAVSET
jgi:hypothetical protein